jgi:anti-sigma-K factor RskA
MSDFEYEAFADVEAALRQMTPADSERLQPSADLWERIEAELAADGAIGDDHGAAAGTVVSLEHRRRSRVATIAFAAAAALIVAIAGVVVVSRDGSGEMVVAHAVLTHDTGFDELGSTSVAEAELIDDGDGQFRLQIHDADLPSALGEPADLEVWLIEPDDAAGVADLVSLGLVDPDDPGTFVVPDDYDPATYFVVDISVEPRDGNGAHSGRSILRGPLQQV